jgi:hypothetical protein
MLEITSPYSSATNVRDLDQKLIEGT